MKFLKYIFIAFASMVALASCEKHDLGYDMEQVNADKALVAIYRLIPEATLTATRMYRVDIDDQPLWQDNYTYLATRGMKPSQARHYIMEPGVHNIKCYLQDGTLYYEGNFTAIKGMQHLCITNLNADPVVIDNNAEYPTEVTAHTAESVYVRFTNLMYEDENYTIPEYKLQYWYQDPTDLEWYPASDPIGFGEASSWYRVHVDQFADERSGESGTGSSRKWANNRVEHTVSAGYCTIYFKLKMIGADGSDLGWFTYDRKGGEPTTEYKDYWTMYIGRTQYHYMRGCRISGNSSKAATTSNTAAWMSQIYVY